MSEDVTAVVDETPPPDIVEQPARARGVYKLCMECGQNVLRFEYRAGSSVCKACEAKAAGLGGEPVVSVEEVAAPEGLRVAPATEGPLPQDMPASGAAEGSAEALEWVVPETTLRGSVEARDWLARQCGVKPPEALTLARVAAHLGHVLEQQAQMIGRVTRYGVPAEIRPEDVPLEVAAEALYLACDPLLQEKLRAAMEVLRLALNQVILGNLAYHEQELLNQDQSLVPQASYAVQYGTGRGLLQQGGGRGGIPGRPLIDAQGQLVKDCLCCGRAFHPTPQRPNPDFCDEACGTFVDQLRIWATNTVLNELRYPGTTVVAPAPDPRTYWPVARCQEPFLTAALAFREQRAEQQMAQAREQQQKMRGI